MNNIQRHEPRALIIMMSRYPEPGKTKTRLIPELGEEGAAFVSSEMGRHLSDMMRYASVLPLDTTGEFTRNPRTDYETAITGASIDAGRRLFNTEVVDQGNGLLGERMKNVIKKGFERDYDVVAVIGSDCPGLTGALMNKALRTALKLKGGALIGANDGGYCMLALHRRAHDRLDEIFANIEWSTEKVLAQQIQQIELAGLFSEVIETQVDVDLAEDLPYWYEIKSRWTKPAKKLSIIIPALDEAETIGLCITQARNYFAQSASDMELEIIAVDGGSSDETMNVAQSHGAIVLSSSKGRAKQMNAGAKEASGDILLFLHADTLLRTPRKPTDIRRILKEPLVMMGAFTFDFGLHGVKGRREVRVDQLLLSRIFSFNTKLRVKFGGLPYGDQAFFVRREVFEALGGYPDYPVMEDFEFARRCERLGEIAISPDVAETSIRRYLKYGIMRVMLTNQATILKYNESKKISDIVRFRRRKLRVRSS